MRKIRINICGYDSPVHNGGPLQWLMRMPHELRERCFDCRILLFAWAPAMDCLAYRHLTNAGFTVSFTLFRDTISNIRWLLDECAADMPQVFIANHVVPALYAASFLRDAGVATVGVIRSDDDFYDSIIDQFIANKSRFNLTSVICVSDFLCDKVRLLNTINPLLCRTIPSGATVPSSCAVAPDGFFHALYVGRLVHKQKRVLDLVKALEGAKKSIPALTADLIGDGEARLEIEHYLDSRKINWIRLRGSLCEKEVIRAMLVSHCLVLLSDYEGAPMAVMEAMACGLPSVCLKIRSGIADLILHGQTGIIVADREASFASAIATLAEDADLWTRLSHGARQRAEIGFSVQVCADKWAALLVEIAPPDIPAPLRAPLRFRLPPPLPGFAHQDLRPVSFFYSLRRRVKERARFYKVKFEGFCAKFCFQW